MLKANLDLNDTIFVNYQHIDLERNWRSVSVINTWLKVRNFDLSKPIFVSRNDETNELIFFQKSFIIPKRVLIVHPNPQILEQLTKEFKNSGHQVKSYQRVERANKYIQNLFNQKQNIDYVIVPKYLKVLFNCTYKSFLNQVYPNLQVLTCDNKDYRDIINMKVFQKDHKNVIKNI